MKQLFSIFLSLSLLLLNGYGNIYAHTQEEPVSYADLQIAANQTHVGFSKTLQTDAPTTKFIPSITEEESEKIFFEEVEDENKEQTYLRGRSNYFSDYYGLLAGNLRNTLSKCSPSAEHFSFSPSYRYILFQVIRI